MADDDLALEAPRALHRFIVEAVRYTPARTVYHASVQATSVSEACVALGDMIRANQLDEVIVLTGEHTYVQPGDQAGIEEVSVHRVRE